MASIPVAWPEGQGLTFWLDPSSAQAKRLEAVLVLLGGSVTRDLTQASHLLLDVEATHPSLLDILATSGRAQGKSVLSLDWAWRSIQAGQPIGEQDYTIPRRPPPSTPLAAAAVVEQGDAPPVASASASTSSSHSSAPAIAVPVRILAPAAPAPEPERHPSGPSRKGKEREVVEVHADAAPIRTTRSSLSHFRTPGSTTSPPYLASSRLSLSSPLVQSRIPLPVSSFGSKTHHRPRPLLLPTPAASAASPPEAFPPPSSVPELAAFAPKESHSSSPVVPRAAAAAPASASSPGVPPAAPSFSRAPPVPATLLPPARSRPAPGVLAEPNSLQPATAASFEREQQNQQPSSALPRLFPCPNLPCDKQYAGKTSLNKHLLACPYRTVYGDDQDEDDPFKIQGGGGTAAAGRGKKKPSLGTGRLSGLDREEELELDERDDGKEEGRNSLHLRNSKASDYTSTVQRPTAHGHFSQRDPHTQDYPSTSVVPAASSSSSQRRPPLSPGSSGKKRRRTVLGPAADVSPTTSNASYRPAAQLALSGTSASLKRRSTGGGGESATAALVPTPSKVSAEGEASLKKQQMASSMARKTTAKANAPPPPPLAPTASTPTRSAAPTDHRNSSSSSRKRGRPSTVGGSGGIGEDLRGGKRLSRVKQESDEEREEEGNRSYEAPPEEEEEEEEDEEEDELESEESFDEFDAFPGHIP